jgi:hypothetical protein
MKKRRVFSLLAGSLVVLAIISVKSARAETTESDWGDLGYSHPEKAKPEVVPMSLADAPAPVDNGKAQDNDEIATTISSAELMQAEPRAAKVEEENIRPPERGHSATDISSVQNTYGVETEERRATQFYASPFAGASSLVGNGTVDSSPSYVAGGTVGALFGQKFMVNVSFTHAETNYSNPLTNSTGILLGSNAFLMKQNLIGAGGKFFILGRESRIRPFVGAGMSYSRGTLDYSSGYSALLTGAQYTNDLAINQYSGYGEIGTEVAITKQLVANISFQMSDVLSSSVGDGSSNYDATRVNVGNSVSQSASYVVSAGVGIYF